MKVSWQALCFKEKLFLGGNTSLNLCSVLGLTVCFIWLVIQSTEEHTYGLNEEFFSLGAAFHFLGNNQ